MSSSPSSLRSGSTFRLRSGRGLNDRLWGLIYRAGDVLRRPRVRRGAAIAAVLLVLGGGAGLYLWLRPVPQPDYLIDDLDDVLGYTFLTDGFNNLPLQERLALIKDLVRRIQGMGSSDSALMAAFAAGITGEARDKLRKNIERLGIDLWDDYAKRYADVPPDKREEWLDDAFVDFSKQMEEIAGQPRNKTKEERLAEARKNAQRGQEIARERDRGMNGQFASGIYGVVNKGSEQATPGQQARMAQFGVQMTRRMRGQDLNTGKPKDPG